jgi:hypothetical protein
MTLVPHIGQHLVPAVLRAVEDGQGWKAAQDSDWGWGWHGSGNAAVYAGYATVLVVLCMLSRPKEKRRVRIALDGDLESGGVHFRQQVGYLMASGGGEAAAGGTDVGKHAVVARAGSVALAKCHWCR